MIDTALLTLNSASTAYSCGESLIFTLYKNPVTIYLYGELGAGKTTFLQGVAKGLGIEDPITSPTYALEQRYQTKIHDEFLHLDLYRLNPAQSREIVDTTKDHKGIRAIEWSERLEINDASESGISIHLDEIDESTRSLKIAYNDIPLPTEEEILQWRKEVLLPVHICNHCDAVAAFAETITNAMLAKGKLVRPLAVKRAAQVHDLLRFVDFRPGASHVEEHHTEEELQTWKSIKDRFANMKHEAACATWLREKGYDSLADIVEVHGLVLPSPERRTIEQQILFYADKRVKVDEIVTLDERFEDFSKRYGAGKNSGDGKIWYQEARTVENDLFPEGIPF